MRLENESKNGCENARYGTSIETKFGFRQLKGIVAPYHHTISKSLYRTLAVTGVISRVALLSTRKAQVDEVRSLLLIDLKSQS